MLLLRNPCCGLKPCWRCCCLKVFCLNCPWLNSGLPCRGRGAKLSLEGGLARNWAERAGAWLPGARAKLGLGGRKLVWRSCLQQHSRGQGQLRSLEAAPGDGPEAGLLVPALSGQPQPPLVWLRSLDQSEVSTEVT